MINSCWHSALHWRVIEHWQECGKYGRTDRSCLRDTESTQAHLIVVFVSVLGDPQFFQKIRFSKVGYRTSVWGPHCMAEWKIKSLSLWGNTFCYNAVWAPWEADAEIDYVRSVLESALGNGEGGSASRKVGWGWEATLGRERHWTVSTESLANIMGSSQDEMTPQSCPKLGWEDQFFTPHIDLSLDVGCFR